MRSDGPLTVMCSLELKKYGTITTENVTFILK